MPDSGVTKTIDKAGDLLKRVNALTTQEVLVGIPADKASRDGPISNAMLGYIHEFGSPARNIPQRPFLFPGVGRIKDKAIEMLRQGAMDAIKGRGDVNATLNAVGMLARNAVVNEITDPDPPFKALLPGTVRGRLRKTAAGRRQLRKMKKGALQEMIEAGDFKPLIDTGQLRASITYVIR